MEIEIGSGFVQRIDSAIDLLVGVENTKETIVFPGI